MAEEDEVYVSHDQPIDFRKLVAGVAGSVAIRLENVSKKLGGRPVLDGVTLHVQKGEVLAIIGGSGAGKSVTLKHIVGLLRPDSGSVWLDGVDVTKAKNSQVDEIRKKIGYVFQNAALLNSISVYENVALPLREHERLSEADVRRRVIESLKQVGMADAIEKMPAELSGGMRRRVGLARALVRNPEIILYDEPTSGLDPVLSGIINQLIVEMRTRLGVTSILVTHDMESVRKVADRVAMLYQGKIHKLGTPREFDTTDDPLVRQFVRGDAEGPITDQFMEGKR